MNCTLSTSYGERGGKDYIGPSRRSKTHKFSCDAYEPNGDNQCDDTRPGVHVGFCLSELQFLAQCFSRDLGMWHVLVVTVLARRIMQVNTRADVAESGSS